ncbi:MAG TPA: transposase [Nitrospira sp.]
MNPRILKHPTRHRGFRPWGQNLHLHPHLHCVVPGGGVSLDGSRWIGCRNKSFFLPVRLLSSRFRKKFLRSLKRAFREGSLALHGDLAPLAEPAAFVALCDKAEALPWVVHVKPPFGGPRRVLKYLARYTHRVAISNHRLRSLENGRVRFDWKDYAHGGRKGVLSLDAVEFIRRFLLHVLPAGLVRIRQFGFLANCVRKQKLKRCHALILAQQPGLTHDLVPTDAKPDPQQQGCPICHLGTLIWVELLRPIPAFPDSSLFLPARWLPRTRDSFQEPRSISVLGRLPPVLTRLCGRHGCRMGPHTRRAPSFQCFLPLLSLTTSAANTGSILSRSPGSVQ